MNEYVIDANVLFSALIKQSDLYEKLTDQFVFYTPDFTLTELQKYRQVILKKSKGDPERLKEFSLQFFRQVVVLPDYIISTDALIVAQQLCGDIDEKDAVYVALSEELRLTLLTCDKPLHDGLKAKGYDRIRMFDDFVREYLP